MLVTGLLLGAVLGAVMQRGRFCVTGMLRDLFTLRQSRGLVALFIVIAVHAVGLAALTSFGVIAPEYRTFKPVAVIVGGFIFGLAIILAGGCASGTWYRSAEGLVGSWFALIFYGLSAAAMKTGVLKGFSDWMKQWDTGLTTINASLGVSAWWLAIPLAVATAYAARHFLARDAARPKATLERKALHPYTAGLLVGILGVVAWPLSAATGRNDGLGITTPSAHLTSWLVTGESAFLNWGTLLVVGLFIGAFIAAKVTGEFRVRVPDAATTLRAIVGGIGMGVGASLAGGCTVGNGMVQTSLFSYQGWVALAAITAGVYVGSKLWLTPKKESAPVSAVQAVPGLINLQQDNKKVRPLGEGRYKLDTLGAVCPFPLIEAKTAIAELDDGEKLVIEFDCTQATESIPQWAADNGHGIEGFEQNQDAGWEVTVVKNAAARVSS